LFNNRFSFYILVHIWNLLIVYWKDFDSLHEVSNLKIKFAKEPKYDLVHQLLVCSQKLYINKLDEIKILAGLFGVHICMVKL